MKHTEVIARWGWSGRAVGAARGLGWPVFPRAHSGGQPHSAGSGEQPEQTGFPNDPPGPPPAVSRETTTAAPQPEEATAAAGESPAATGGDQPVPRGDVPRAEQTGSEGGDPPVPPPAVSRETAPPAQRVDLPRPEQTRVMVVANQKGGVGKTTTAVNVAAALAQSGQRVLVVDIDPQGNASTALSVKHSEGTPSSYDVLTGRLTVEQVAADCPDIPNLTVVPATIDLAGAEVELVSLVARETRLRKALDAYLDAQQARGLRYDYVLVDCPPSLGLLTVNGLAAGRELLIPVQCEYYALEGLSQLLRTIDSVRDHLNPQLRVGAIVLTMYDARTRLAAGVADEVRSHFGDLVLKTAIPRSVRISEAPSYGQPVLTYDPGSAGSLSYLEAASELAAQRRETS